MSIDWAGTDAAVAAALRARGVETDLGDADLAAYARAAVEEISERLGPRSGIERRFDGYGQRFLILSPPAGTITSLDVDGSSLTDGVDYRMRQGGMLLERLSGSSPSTWYGQIRVVFALAAADDRYDRVVTDLVKLGLQYTGLDARRDGDYGEEAMGARGGGQKSYQDEREQLISELVPAGFGFA